MIALILMVMSTVLAAVFLIETGRAGRASAAEVVLSRAWGSRFARQDLEEKKADFLERQEKYHRLTEKKAAKKVREWDKQIAAYLKREEEYLAGKKFSLLDLISLMGYQFLVDLRLDGDSELLRKLTGSCEYTGYVELERDQETGGKKNSAVYAYFLLASLIAYVYMGVVLALFLGVIMLAAGSGTERVVMIMAVGFAGSALYGYIPYDSLRAKAAKRQEEIEQSFPNVISKLTLLAMAGMNIVHAVEETAASGNSLMYRELRIALKEMAQGATVQGAFLRMQNRCDNKYLDKMVIMVTKSYVAGNTNLADDLKSINDECWLDRKHNARRMGEKIQNKLFIPTMLMFIGILVVIVVPAMSGFNL